MNLNYISVIITTDEDLSLRIEGFAIVNLRGVYKVYEKGASCKLSILTAWCNLSFADLLQLVETTCRKPVNNK